MVNEKNLLPDYGYILDNDQAIMRRDYDSSNGMLEKRKNSSATHCSANIAA